jgi:hypothetical protein
MNWPNLRQAFNLWQNKVLLAFAVGFALFALIGGAIWWLAYSNSEAAIRRPEQWQHPHRRESGEEREWRR